MTKGKKQGLRAEDRKLKGAVSAVTHVDAQNLPRMVDVGAKAVTAREACARAIVRFARRGHRESGGRAPATKG